MPLSNLEQEDLWLSAWDELYELLEKYGEAFLLLPEYLESSLEDVQGWIQDEAYRSRKIVFQIEFYKGRESIVLFSVPASK